MRNLLTLVSICVVFSVLSLHRSAYAGETPPSPSMFAKSHAHAIGTWRCSVAFPAIGGQKAFTAHPTVTIDDSPNSTLHIRFVHPGAFMSDYYIGYNTKLKADWMNAIDTSGGVVVQTSKDGIVYDGTSWDGSQHQAVRDTWTMVSDTKLRDITEVQEHGKWIQGANVACTKA